MGEVKKIPTRLIGLGLGREKKYSVKYLIAKSKLKLLKDIGVLFMNTVEKCDSLSKV